MSLMIISNDEGSTITSDEAQSGAMYLSSFIVPSIPSLLHRRETQLPNNLQEYRLWVPDQPHNKWIIIIMMKGAFDEARLCFIVPANYPEIGNSPSLLHRREPQLPIIFKWWKQHNKQCTRITWIPTSRNMYMIFFTISSGIVEVWRRLVTAYPIKEKTLLILRMWNILKTCMT